MTGPESPNPAPPAPAAAPSDEAMEDAPRVREPVYATGPPLSVPAEAVQLTLLDPESLRAYAAAETDDEGETETAPESEFRSAVGVRIPVFEGPLDLLLHLIRRDKLDIYDIPIGHITEQYLSMLGLMTVLDLEVAGDFLVMAATLMRIKARMLLPTWPEDEDEDDPRAGLVAQLLEYRKFKEAAGLLKEREAQRRLEFGRGFVPEFTSDELPELMPVSAFVLIEVMKDVLSRVGEEFFYSVELEDVTLEEKIALITRELAEEGRVLFVDLVTRFPRRIHIVVTFMAILELARLGRLAIAQEANFGQIWLYPARPAPPVVDHEAEAAPEPRPEAGGEMELFDIGGDAGAAPGGEPISGSGADEEGNGDDGTR